MGWEKPDFTKHQNGLVKIDLQQTNTATEHQKFPYGPPPPPPPPSKQVPIGAPLDPEPFGREDKTDYDEYKCN